MKTFDSGARSSEEAPRLDLIPVASLIRQAARMAEGAQSHGERNFEKGARDPVFIRDRKNHLLAHALAYVNGQDDDDHLGAILANAGMLARIEQINAVPILDSGIANVTVDARGSWTYDEKRASPVPCRCGRVVHSGQHCADGCIMERHPSERVPAVPAE